MEVRKISRWIKQAAMVVAALSGFGFAILRLGYLDSPTWSNILFWVAICNLFMAIAIPILESRALADDDATRRLAVQVTLDAYCDILKGMINTHFSAYIMQPEGLLSKKLRIKYHSSDLENSPFLKITYEKYQCWAGAAWGMGEKISVHPNFNDSMLGLSREMLEVHKELKTIVSSPFPAKRVLDRKYHMLFLLIFHSIQDCNHFEDRNSPASKKIDEFMVPISRVLNAK